MSGCAGRRRCRGTRGHRGSGHLGSADQMDHLVHQHQALTLEEFHRLVALRLNVVIGEPDLMVHVAVTGHQLLELRIGGMKPVDVLPILGKLVGEVVEQVVHKPEMVRPTNKPGGRRWPAKDCREVTDFFSTLQSAANEGKMRSETLAFGDGPPPEQHPRVAPVRGGLSLKARNGRQAQRAPPTPGTPGGTSVSNIENRVNARRL